MMLNIVEYCWMMLDADGRCWILLDDVGRSIKFDSVQSF